MKNKQILTRLNQASIAIVLLTVFALPLKFNPFGANIFDLSKNILLAVSSSLLLIMWMVKNIIRRSFRITVSPITGMFVLFSLIVIASGVGATLPRTIETFVNYTSSYFFLMLFFLSATTLPANRRLPKRIMMAIISSGVVLSILAVLETINFGPGKLISLLSNTSSTGVFVTPAGSAVILLSFIIPCLLFSLAYAITQKNAVQKSLLFIGSAILTAATVVSAFTILPGKPNAPVLLPLATSWNIAVENIKSPKGFVIGVGPSNYIRAFSKFRGVEFNQNEFWNTRFNTARNLPLYLFVTSGLLGLTSWIILLVSIGLTVKKTNKLSMTAKFSLIGIAAMVLITLFIPSNLVLYSLLVFLLVTLITDLKANKEAYVSELSIKLFAAKLVRSDTFDEKDEKQTLKTELLPVVLGIPVIILTLFVFYGSYRVLAADHAFKQSLTASAENDGTKTYDSQRRAIELFPYSSNYHRAYAGTNFALANSLSSQEDLSDNDKQTVSTLIRQAIREGQSTVQINPYNPANWETLAGIYRNLINVAEGADQWTVASYTQAINLDSVNPRLWVDLGGVYYQLQAYPQAIEYFQRAAQLKPDYANARYNLANALAKNKEIERAIAQYDAVLQLVDPSTTDYTTAQNEANTLREQLGQAPTVQQPVPTQLTTPDPTPTPLPGSENLELTEEDAPPVDNPRQRPEGGFGNVVEPEASDSGATGN